MAPASLMILQYLPFTKSDLKRRDDLKALIAAKEQERLAKETQQNAFMNAQRAKERAMQLAKEAEAALQEMKKAEKEAELAMKATQNASARVAEEEKKLEGKKQKRN